MSKVCRSVLAFLVCAGSAVSVSAQWVGGESVLINPEQSVTVNVPEPNIICLTNNGTLLFAAGGSVSITGNVLSAIGADGETGVMTVASGGQVFVTGNVPTFTTFAVGFQGGEGTLDIQPGGVFDAGNAMVTVCANNSGTERDPATRGTLNVAGLFRAGTLGITSFFPNAPEDEYVTAGVVNLLPSGVLEIRGVQKNDRAYSHFYFKGGTLKCRAAGMFHTGGYGAHLYYIIEENCDAIFDTAGYNVTFNEAAGAFVSITGDGGLVKRGEGALTFTLADTNNTFTGDIVVEEGTLCLGRPLAQGQTVTVHDGAMFYISAASDVPNVTYLGEGPYLFTVGADIDTLDLTALAPTFHADCIGGPFAGFTTTLSGPLTYDPLAGTALNPFRLIGQGGMLCLTNTGLENAYIQIDGPDFMEFQGDRIFTPADEGKISFSGSGMYRQRGLFTLAGGAAFTVDGPARFATVGTGNALQVAAAGDTATFVSSNAAVSLDRLRVGGEPGAVGLFTQDGGTVTSAAEVIVGYNSGTGTLNVANGNFTISGSLRLALNDSADKRSWRPHGIVNITNGTLQANQLNFTPYFPTDNSPGDALHGEVNILAGGLLNISDINKNDSALSLIQFDGGTLRIRNNNQILAIGANAALHFAATAGNYIAFDIGGADARFQPSGRRIAFTGDGGFKKLGNGMFSLFGHRIDYAGDTVVEAGTLRLVGQNQIPHGAGKGNVILHEGACLDLYGNDAALNRVEGPGIIVNMDTNNRVSTLSLLADGSDGYWDGTTAGRVALNKLGGGTLTLSGYGHAPDGLTISGGTVRIAPSAGYPFYRFKVEEAANANPAMMQFCALSLYNGATDLVPLRTNATWDATYTDEVTANQTYPVNESPPNVLDGNLKPERPDPETGNNVCTKWLDFRIDPLRSPEDRDRVWIRLDYQGVQKLTHYNWATANDHNDRDPTAWRLQGSYTGDDWADIDVVSGFECTSWRYAWAGGPGGFPVNTANQSGRTIAPDAPVALAGGASLILDGVSETLGGLTGFGSVTLDGGDLTLHAASGATHVFAGDISGDGAVIKTGPGTQTLSGANAFTGGLTVREGIAEINVMPPTFDWFRFTIKDNRNRINVLQFSELALYDESGARWNLGLTEGSDVTTLNPGEVATPEAYSIGNGEENFLKLFDGDLTGARSKWCLNNNTATPSDPATWRTLVMRLTNGAPETALTSYNLATANDSPERDPITWVMEGSPDGNTWFHLDSQTGHVPVTNRCVWYNGGTPIPFTSPATLGADAGTIAAGSIVEVQSGATLSINGGPVPISALRVDMAAGGGTITRFTPAAGGTLHLTNASGSPSSWQIPITFGSVDDPSILSKWQVSADGTLLRGYLLVYDPATGTLRLVPKGTIIILK
ncbi:MAG: autotransporter-associated beta strand repeat-containing protein [Kiritimatiellaeota bacterium]|nr:autotransporter-associated beta strand repeat-containing protein [Kiritimatiellota bacterium]